VAVFTVSRFTENLHSLCNVFTDHPLEIEIIALSQVEGVCLFLCMWVTQGLGPTIRTGKNGGQQSKSESNSSISWLSIQSFGTYFLGTLEMSPFRSKSSAFL